LANFHRSKLARASVVVSSVKETGDFGRIVLDELSRITGFKEKADTAPGYVNAGVYCFNEDIFSLMPEEAAFSLEYDFFPLLVGKGFYGFPVGEEFFDIGTPQRYEKAKKKFT
jgi:NDP-sugar pyrophosphorylase family protein